MNRDRNKAYVRKCRDKLSDAQKKHLNQYYCRTWRSWIGRRTNAAIVEDRNKGRECNITTDSIKTLLDISGDCAITGICLTHDKSLSSLSIDRIDNSIGHTVANVHLVCMGINLARNKASLSDIKSFVDCICGSPFVPIKVSRDFISTCVRNAAARSLKNGWPFELNTDVILELYRANNRCALSGIHMAAYKNDCFSLSIDRIDSSKPYVLSNVRLLCRGINLARGQRPDSEVLAWIEAIRHEHKKRSNCK